MPSPRRPFADFDDEPGEVREEEWWALAYRYEQEFLKAYDTLGVSRPTYEPRATGHIPKCTPSSSS